MSKTSTPRSDNVIKFPNRQNGQNDWIVKRLEASGLPVTRENYLRLFYFGQIPQPWTAEHEEELPSHLQDWSQVTLNVRGRHVELDKPRAKPHPLEELRQAFPRLTDAELDYIERTT